MNIIRPESSEDLPVACTIRSSRMFAVSPGPLWTLFENPEHLGTWWGPSGFTNTFETFDFRDGGTWRFVMHGPNGAAYPMRKTFVAIRKPEVIVLDHDDPVHGFRMFMNFRDAVGGTRLDWIMVFDHAEEAARVRPFVEPANEQNFDRLGECIKTL